MGDSSGAHLALCLSRYIHDLNIPHPGHIALTSPLGDCSTSLPSRINLKGIDILASNMDRKPLASATRHFTREAVKNNAYFAPARASAGEWMYLKDGEVKVYIMVGTKEILLDDTMGIVKGMKDAGVDIVLRKVSERARLRLTFRIQRGTIVVHWHNGTDRQLGTYGSKI